jgi:hypothetical protein
LVRVPTTEHPQPFAGASGFQPTLVGVSAFPVPASCPPPLLLVVPPLPLLLLPPLLETPPELELEVLLPLPELEVLDPELLPLLLLVLDPLPELEVLDPELLPLLLPLLEPELLLLDPPGLWRSAPFGVPQPVGPS